MSERFPSGPPDSGMPSPERAAGSPRWEKPALKEERGELERTARELQLQLDALVAAYEAAQLEVLSEEDWVRMENCDSANGTWTVESVREHLKPTRDFGRIERGTAEGDVMPAPIVLYRNEHPPYLIGGNSRLLACRVFKQRPTVLKVLLEAEARDENQHD